MSADGLKVHPMARLLGLVPVVLIAGGIIAAMLGYRPEGRAPTTVEWRTHSVTEIGFAVAAPGVFIVNRQVMGLGGTDAPADVYLASDLGVNFSVSVVQRPEDDGRSFTDVAKEMGLRGTDPAQREGGLTVFQHNVTVEGTRTRAQVIFHDRMMYQLMVSSPAAAFSEANADRFFNSFRLIPKT